ncbi:sugar phosphate isomerase/epimerase family protein, partial [Kitasatospora herbaricolor]|uniref:sugar phosphate isomerase/epimerase family protein n=1 Tax=Kitasatospora herbaricolor TaxID=68217 RepID=UPI0036DA8470
MQLYTVRELLTEDTVGTLKRIADLGFTQVEPFAFLSFGDDLGRGLSEAGLTAPTTHQSFIGGELEPVFEAAKALGIETVIDPFVAPERWQTAESVDEIASQLNAAAEVAARYGVRVGYHNHA